MIDIRPVPNRLTRPDTLDDDADRFFNVLPQFGDDLLALQGSVGTLAAGTAYAIPYQLDLSTTADADPGNGKLRFNASDLSLATTLYVDTKGTDAVDYTGSLDTFDASTSNIKGQLRIFKQGDPTKFMTFQVTGKTVATGYRKLAVSLLTMSFPQFGATDNVIVKFTATGDKGDSVAALPTLYVRDQKTAATHGGASSAGLPVQRDLNTVVINTITGASLLANAITLPAGTYRVRGSAPAYGAQQNRIYLEDAGSPGVLMAGTSAYAGTGSMSLSLIAGPLVLTSAKTLRIMHYTQTSIGTSSLGVACGGNLGFELYTEIMFEKYA